MGEENSAVNELLKKTSLNDSSPIFYFNSDGSKEELLSEKKLRFYTDKIIETLMNDFNRRHNSMDGNMLLKNILEAKKIWYPATQKSITANVNLFDDHLKKWIDARQQLPNNNIEVIKMEITNAENEIL